MEVATWEMNDTVSCPTRWNEQATRHGSAPEGNRELWGLQFNVSRLKSIHSPNRHHLREARVWLLIIELMTKLKLNNTRRHPLPKPPHPCTSYPMSSRKTHGQLACCPLDHAVECPLETRSPINTPKTNAVGPARADIAPCLPPQPLSMRGMQGSRQISVGSGLFIR